MREVAKNAHQDLWIEAIDAKFENAGNPWGRADFDRILSGFEVSISTYPPLTPQRSIDLYNVSQGLSDYPAAIFPRELAAAYPEAAIILSSRPEDKWFASMMSTLVHHHVNRRADDTSPMAPLARKYHRYCWGEDFPATGREFFRRHNELVRELGEGRRFLEWRPEDGWGPLCVFLGVEAPEEGRPFPRSDDWVEYKKMVEKEREARV